VGDLHPHVFYIATIPCFGMCFPWVDNDRNADGKVTYVRRRRVANQLSTVMPTTSRTDDTISLSQTPSFPPLDRSIDRLLAFSLSVVGASEGYPGAGGRRGLRVCATVFRAAAVVGGVGVLDDDADDGDNAQGFVIRTNCKAKSAPSSAGYLVLKDTGDGNGVRKAGN
jgi:hypothetical protein